MSDKWISIEDRKPDDYGDVVVAGIIPNDTNEKIICVGFYNINQKNWILSFAGEEITNVTHWMPLPSLPKGE